MSEREKTGGGPGHRWYRQPLRAPVVDRDDTAWSDSCNTTISNFFY